MTEVKHRTDIKSKLAKKAIEELSELHAIIQAIEHTRSQA